MNRFWRTILICGVTIVLWEQGKKYYNKKKGIRTYDNGDLEEIQKNCHLAIDELTGKKYKPEEIESLVMDITKI